MVATYLVEVGQRGLRSEREVAQVLGVPTLAMVPRLDGPRRAGIAAQDYVLERPRSRYAEALREILTGLMLRRGEGGEEPSGRVVLVTSALPGEGKSTLTLSLARAAAAEGLRVMVIDADLRKPSLHELVGLQAGGGAGRGAAPGGAAGRGAGDRPARAAQAAARAASACRSRPACLARTASAPCSRPCAPLSISSWSTARRWSRWSMPSCWPGSPTRSCSWSAGARPAAISASFPARPARERCDHRRCRAHPGRPAPPRPLRGRRRRLRLRPPRRVLC